MRTARKAAIFVESQDSILFKILRIMGKTDRDFEVSGNYVYRWSRREIEKISLSAHAHSFAMKTIFLPVLERMKGVTGTRKKRYMSLLGAMNKLFGPVGNSRLPSYSNSLPRTSRSSTYVAMAITTKTYCSPTLLLLPPLLTATGKQRRHHLP